MKLVSNKALRDFASRHPDAENPLKSFRQKVERGRYRSVADLRMAFVGVDKVGDRFVFNIGGDKYRLIAGIQFATQRLYVKAILTHHEYDKGAWK